MKIRIGTRGSELALTQTGLVARAIEENLPGISVELVTIKTTGDLRQGTADAALLDKKAWVAELENALTAGEIDLAIHSGKDAPNDTAYGTELCAVLKRENPLDVFIGRIKADGSRLRFEELSEDAAVGTASTRRAAFLKALSSSFRIREHRGNVTTRIRKLDQSEELEGIVLAAAGIERLAVKDLDYQCFTPEQMVPAINQGILVAQLVASRTDIKEIVAKISDPATEKCFLAEREFSRTIGADCHSAVGAYARIEFGKLIMSAAVLSSDGTTVLRADGGAAVTEAARLGDKLASDLLEQGAGELL